MQERMRHIVRHPNTKSHVPLNSSLSDKSQVSVNAPQTGISPTPKSVLNNPVTPVVTGSSAKNAGFYQHNSIKCTIAPYEVHPSRYISENGISLHELPPMAQNVAYSMGANSASLGVISTLGVQPNSEYYAPKKVPSNDIVIPTRKPLLVANAGIIQQPYPNMAINHRNSMSMLPPSSVMPPNCDPKNFLLATNIYSYVTCRNNGMSLPSATILTAFKYGYPGANIDAMCFVGKTPILRGVMNLQSYVKPQHFGTLTPKLQRDLSMVSVNRFMSFYETVTAGQVNQHLIYPLQFNETKLDLKPNNLIENLTGQSRPDYLRDLHKSIFGIVCQGYDQKSYHGPMLDANHVRPTPDNLGNTINLANKHLVDNLKASFTDFGEDGYIARHLQNYLLKIATDFSNTQNDTEYMAAYNSIRDHEIYGAFLIKHHIPMNLVAQVSLDCFPLDEKHIEEFNRVFLHAYYSPDSPVVRVFQKILHETNGFMVDTKTLYKLIVEAALTPPQS